MKSALIMLISLCCGLTAMAQDPNPEIQNKLHAGKERIQHMQIAADNLQAAGMEREANQLREQARHMASELEQLANQAREQAAHDQPNPERAAAERAKREQMAREHSAAHGDQAAISAEARLQAQIEELRMTVHHLAERIEHMEAAMKPKHDGPVE